MSTAKKSKKAKDETSKLLGHVLNKKTKISLRTVKGGGGLSIQNCYLYSKIKFTTIITFCGNNKTFLNTLTILIGDLRQTTPRMLSFHKLLSWYCPYNLRKII
jgi:hypothetical protein